MLQNNFNFIGRVAKNPEQKKVGNSVVTTVRIAVNRKVGDKTRTDFFDIRMWNRLGDTAFKYLNKGRLIAVTGFIKTRITEINGKKVKFYDFVADDFRFLDSKKKPNENDGIADEAEIEKIEEEIENISDMFEEDVPEEDLEEDLPF